MLQIAELAEEPRAAALISKATYDIATDGSLVPSGDPLPISPDPLETPFGTFHGELFFKKAGADVCVLGTVRRRSPVRELVLKLRVADLVNQLVVCGDRVWLPTGDRRRPLAPSRAQPFTEMPLGYDRAFGGVADYEGYPAPWPDNPVGRGYYLTAEQAREHPLPNIEPADGVRVGSWEDHPRVCGWGPYSMTGALRASTAVTVDPEKMHVTNVDPSLFNNAHPDLVVPELTPGDMIDIEGMGDDPVRVMIPKMLLRLQVSAGAHTSEAMSRIDGVFLWLDARKVVITQRANFSYVFQPRELRRVTATAVEA